MLSSCTGWAVHLGESCPTWTFFLPECDWSCNACKGPRRTDCLQCMEGYVLHEGACVEQCPAAFYKESDTCQSESFLCGTSNHFYQWFPACLQFVHILCSENTLQQQVSLPSSTHTHTQKSLGFLGCYSTVQEAIGSGVELNSLCVIFRVWSTLPSVSPTKRVQPLWSPVFPLGCSVRSQVWEGVPRRPGTAKMHT